MAVPGPAPVPHHWYTPAECASLLGGTPHGERFRAPCPVHGGEIPRRSGLPRGATVTATL